MPRGAPTPKGASWSAAILAVLWKDLLLESRTREIVTPILVFSLLVIVIFSFVLDPNPRIVASVAPAALWVAFTFAGILGLNRSFALEKERGGMEGLLLSPVGRDLLYFGKMLGAFLFMLAVEIVMLPAFSVMFNLPLVVARPLARRRPRDVRLRDRRHRLFRHGRQHPGEGDPAARALFSRRGPCYHSCGRGDQGRPRR